MEPLHDAHVLDFILHNRIAYAVRTALMRNTLPRIVDGKPSYSYAIPSSVVPPATNTQE